MTTQLITVITTLLVTVTLTSWWHWLYPCDENTICHLPGLSLFLPLLSSQRVLSRLYSVVLSLIVPFLLLSASHEGLFILALILNMFCWLLLELHSADSAKNKVMSQGLLYTAHVGGSIICFVSLPRLSKNINCKCSGKVETNGQK